MSSMRRDSTLPPFGGYAVFAGVLAAAGLPLYIHAPKVYVDTYGVSLAALGSVLFGLRLLDVVQDPLLGRLAERTAHVRLWATGIALGILVIGMLALFAVTPLLDPMVWFAGALVLVFSAFSFLTISFYAQGVRAADLLGGSGHLRLARWRETGALIGVCLAAIAPVVLSRLSGEPYAAFAIAFAVSAMIGGIMMRQGWAFGSSGPVSHPNGSGFGVVLRDRDARHLLLLALVNAAPVAVSSTLFLFFVESRLGATGAEGPLLLLFFLSAAVSASLWGRLAERFGTKPVLMAAMVLAISAFGFALGLGTGDVLQFALICTVTGAVMGADLTLLPAAFAARMARIAPDAAQGFGLWNFASKLSLAFAAVALFPILEGRGFISGGENGEEALWVLSLLYAGVPCALKLLAIGLLIPARLERS